MHTRSDRPRIDGIKVSNELVAVKLQSTEEGINTESRLCGVLAKEKINMPFLSISRRGNSVSIICCVDKGEERHAVEVLSPVFTRGGCSIKFIRSAGLISIFPHRSSFKIFIHALSVFVDSGIPVYGMSSSLSTLSFLTDFAAMERLIGLITEQFILPPDHVPLRTEIKIKQIVISQAHADQE